jgi:hypothetical protein
MLLDELLADLDSFARIALQAELIALWECQRFTTFLVTHDVDEACYIWRGGAGAKPAAGARSGGCHSRSSVTAAS